MTTLKKVLSWQDGAAFAVTAVMGTGILILPALTADMAGPAALVAWVLMGILVVPMAWTLGDLAVLYPAADGIAGYVRHAFGDRWARLVGYLYLGTVPLGAPAAALIGMGYVTRFFHWGAVWGILGALMMLAVALTVNTLGVELSGRTANGVVIAIMILVASAIGFAIPHRAPHPYTPFAPHGWVPVGTAFALLYWAFIGWEMVGHMAEEFHHPRRDLPKALLASLVVIDGLYLGVAWVTVRTHTYGLSTGDGLARLVGLGLGSVGALWAVLTALFITYGSIHTYVAGFSRLVYAQARSGDLPAYFAELHPHWRTPVRVFIALAIPFIGVLGWDAFRPFSLNALISWPSAMFIALYILAMAAGWRLASRRTAKIRAASGLVLSLVALGFLGWAALFPLIVIIVGWRGRKNRLIVAET